jgi:uncharacterized protein
MKMSDFEWDDDKNQENILKHGVSFREAQEAFKDDKRIIAEDLDHSAHEERWFCFGMVNNQIMTVRFTFRGNRIRIYGAGYWRKGKNFYEEKNRIH